MRRLWLFVAGSMTLLAIAIPCILCPARASGQAASDATQPATVIQTTSSLVVVRVVVRDSKGNPVEGLKKEDFKLFDRGKEQTISQFEAQSATASATSVVPANFLALYFDDLDVTDADLNQARDAADRYLSAHLEPQDRVGIFASGGMLSDFTADRAQLHEALLKLRISAHGLSRMQDCPNLSDYQASEIMRTPLYDSTNDAWRLAMEDALQCAGVPPGNAGAVAVAQNNVRAKAFRVVDQARLQMQTNLDGIAHAVAAIQPMPGRRTVVLISPGFLTEDDGQALVNRVIDQALRAQVVISTLDPKGVSLLLREADASRRDLGNANNSGAAYGVDKTRELLARATLDEIAHGTGGVYFHNNNDLNAGFGAVGGSPAYYMLAFAPANVKLDGQFHELKVAMAGEHKGLTLETRRGYFAAPSQPKSTAMETAVLAGGIRPSANPTVSPTAPDPVTHEMIREALFAKTDTAQLTVTLDTKIGGGQSEARELSVSSHLDGMNLPFRKEGENSQNTVTFVFAVFDAKGNMLAPQQKHDDLDVSEGQMPGFLKAGVDEGATFQLKPGSYRLREVVIDAAEHRMTSFSRNVKIP